MPRGGGCAPVVLRPVIAKARRLSREASRHKADRSSARKILDSESPQDQTCLTPSQRASRQLQRDAGAQQHGWQKAASGH
jgi:hypothetical protein